MDITPLLHKTSQVIQSYGPQGFTITGREYPGSVMVFPHETRSWDVKDWSEVNEESLAPLLGASGDMEIVLIGSGVRQEFLPPALRQLLRQRGIVAEVMDTGAACRTFNVLLSEARRVAAALVGV